MKAFAEIEMTKIVWEIPLKTVSEANCTEHWRIKSQRHKCQQFLIRQLFKHEAQEIPFPCEVKMVRLGPKFLDSDNLGMAFKWIRDELSECLIPYEKFVIKANGARFKLKGRVDSDPRILWSYDQLKTKIQGIRIEISHWFPDPPLNIGHE